MCFEFMPGEPVAGDTAYRLGGICALRNCAKIMGIIYFSCRLSFIDRKSRVSGDRSIAVGEASTSGASGTSGAKPPLLSEPRRGDRYRRLCRPFGALNPRVAILSCRFRFAAVAASLHRQLCSFAPSVLSTSKALPATKVNNPLFGSFTFANAI